MAEVVLVIDVAKLEGEFDQVEHMDVGRGAGAGCKFEKDRFAGEAVGARVLSRLERVSACREVWGEGSIVQGEVA